MMSQLLSNYYAERSLHKNEGSGAPLPDGGIAEKTLILEILEPCLDEGVELLLQPRIDLGFLAVIAIAVNLLHEAHVIVPERQRLRHVGSSIHANLKDHFRIAHHVAARFPAACHIVDRKRNRKSDHPFNLCPLNG